MRHPYHLLDLSPWPLLISFNLLSLLIGLLGYLNGYISSLNLVLYSLIMVIIIFTNWLYDVMSESLYLGFHLNEVSRGLALGFLLFILTEIMLFFSFFWSYFHSALNPTYLIWPPIGIDLINPWSIPLLNTFLLLYSGISATWAHHSLINNNRKESLLGLGIGIVLGVIFFILQLFEYFNSTYDITDSVYSSAFYLTTGAHGLHVVVGVLMLFFTWIRIYFFHSPSLLFDLSLLYYHFVDIVWIALFILIYYMAY
uniref:cytochrome c oxidase subunit 3 n=1 Tax=Amoeboaphelidium protococcarum TaxID=1243177 RepID=UPI002238E656|nr:cytochrome c oxidase subunit 3 [Amoeboaphelidium protococcarum]UYP50888.1 cytochrome c oxidase subunit 3 [Amoeboaphelidium protococcarum]UYP50910.1 cytochrome c oxidase subunit 3 [Amoeboaphelidium protococcarum]